MTEFEGSERLFDPNNRTKYWGFRRMLSNLDAFRTGVKICGDVDLGRHLALAAWRVVSAKSSSSLQQQASFSCLQYRVV